MNLASFAPKRLFSLGVVVVCAAGLSGCFDLPQKVAIGRDGSGGYQVAVAADGIVGEGLSRHKADIDLDGDMPMHTKISVANGKTTQTTGTAFHDLSQLALSDETISLHVKGKKLLGLAGTEMNFHRTFHIDSARRHHEEDSDDHLGKDILTSMFGDHTYTFSVWLPGSVDSANTLWVGGHEVKPVVTAHETDGYVPRQSARLRCRFHRTRQFPRHADPLGGAPPSSPPQRRDVIPNSAKRRRSPDRRALCPAWNGRRRR
jgi:hypothetical protein